MKWLPRGHEPERAEKSRPGQLPGRRRAWTSSGPRGLLVRVPRGAPSCSHTLTSAEHVRVPGTQGLRRPHQQGQQGHGQHRRPHASQPASSGAVLPPGCPTGTAGAALSPGDQRPPCRCHPCTCDQVRRAGHRPLVPIPAPPPPRPPQAPSTGSGSDGGDRGVWSRRPRKNFEDVFGAKR